MKNYKRFGDLARDLREKTGLKRETLAKQMGYQRGCGHYIQQIEEGTAVHSADAVAKYKRYFSLNLNYLLRLDAKDLQSRLITRLKKRKQTICSLLS